MGINTKKQFFFKKLKLNSFIIPASGTISWDFNQFFQQQSKVLNCLITKTISYHAMDGNYGEKIYVGFNYIVNSIGLRNPGLNKFLLFYFLPFIKNNKTSKLIISVLGRLNDAEKIILELDKYSQIIGYEINLSCPNLKKEDKINYFDLQNILRLLKRIRQLTKKNIFIKLSSIILEVICSAMAEINKIGINAITISNSLHAVVPDSKNNSFYFKNIFAGISGPAIKYQVIAEIIKIKKLTNIPIIGCGGVRTFIDVLDYLKAGAEIVEIGSANFYEDHDLYKNILSDLEKFLKEHNLKLENVLKLR